MDIGRMQSTATHVDSAGRDPVHNEAIKLVLAGPVGAGKTTAIRSIADGEPISTEMPMTEGASGGKTTTTVAFDFASIALDDGPPLLVYGMPGQDHFAFMRPIIMAGAIGGLVVLSARQADLAAECERWLRVMLDLDPGLAIAIGITHSELVPAFSLAPVRAVVRRMGRPIPAFTFDARDREQSMHLVRALLVSVPH